ncbi:hypothetical protein PAAG_11431 [Paracoccidioides lutzii Pb01]|uniref:Uncharacterized protein n=1 Tax=Paracoccidioides lutzii (strain ATCC MYA-826 / Pb01) TaxID=502779 RepID=A0A0A2V6V9_PARBA|nr:hypothetical protein PAAG_11431 [Paracoccidioides lutzii Pb01]KGQ01855.1 hypothetical protein PAAG_11431 [Paracoccidioides lutzii Pb01]
MMFPGHKRDQGTLDDAGFCPTGYSTPGKTLEGNTEDSKVPQRQRQSVQPLLEHPAEHLHFRCVGAHTPAVETCQPLPKPKCATVCPGFAAFPCIRYPKEKTITPDMVRETSLQVTLSP